MLVPDERRDGEFVPDLLEVPRRLQYPRSCNADA
jgi:hypothetical protein